ncbi:alpha/beta hydrolase [Paraburkholderia tropica]|uniref:esterase/lipase family protein n=1 Tax=Paraburkholderia tropica TaxID=92647 RepID=UPI0016029983|nr:alpha/beta fold hydrolase [Paraburkholderia tropica]QNB10309.1 alpha/beta hydrolase [Paraburkholderia tropica]
MSSPLLPQILSQLQAIPADQRLGYIQAKLAEIPDEEERSLIEAGVLLGMHAGTSAPREHVVVLVHGIRTYAEWQERLAAHLTEAGFQHVYPIGYGFFDALRFLSPFFTRQQPIDRVTREIRTIKAKHGDVDVSVVAHSFGTYVMSKIFDDATDLRFHRVVLCGSIVPTKYRWDKVSDRIHGTVINDVGTRDYWPVIASKASWGYGASGTFGFKTATVKDRFHDCGHSEFFSDDLMSRFWVPLLQDGQLVPSAWTRTRPRAHSLLSMLSWLPVKTFAAAAIVLRATSLFVHRALW